MICILDAMSGDNAPLEIVKGAAMALEAYKDVDIVLVGDENIINATAEKAGVDIKRAKLVHADSILTMEDSPRAVVSAKKDSSMAIGLKMLADGEGDAFVSAGNTGALMTGATVYVKNIDGVRRAALAATLPLKAPTLLIDSGANLDPDAATLLQFAVMGSVYTEKQFGLDRARVGLINNGAESHKGTKIVKEAYGLLSESDTVDFVGNVEGKEIPFGKADVLVCDGFTGNVVLKTIEGMGKFAMGELKHIFKKNPLTMFSATLIKGGLRSLKKKFDASEHGGAPLLGIRKPVIKAHGSSDARAIMNAVRQAKVFADTGLIDEIGVKLGEINDGKEAENG